MTQLKCPICGSTSIYCNGITPTRCSAVCNKCHFGASSSKDIERYFGGHASYTKYEGKETTAQVEESFRKLKALSQLREMAQATCSHEWVRRVQGGYGYHYCPKCGAEKP